jgi:hypothetical protein
MHLESDTSEAAGWWIDSAIGERVFPDRVTSLEATFGVRLEDGYAHLAQEVVDRLSAWCAAATVMGMTSAPGGWTLLHCPLHPAGEMVVYPRSAPNG